MASSRVRPSENDLQLVIEETCKFEDFLLRVISGVNMPRKPPPVADTEPSLLLTKAELAEHLRCSERQIDKLTADGKIPRPIMLGNVRRWPRSAVIDWIDRVTRSIKQIELIRSEC